MKYVDLFKEVVRDTSEMLGRHFYLSFLAMIVLFLYVFGIVDFLKVCGVLAFIAFVMWHMPDDVDPFDPNGPRGV